MIEDCGEFKGDVALRLYVGNDHVDFGSATEAIQSLKGVEKKFDRFEIEVKLSKPKPATESESESEIEDQIKAAEAYLKAAAEAKQRNRRSQAPRESP